MSSSQNGWPAFSGWGQDGSATAVVPGTSVKIQGGLRAGDVSTVLLDFAAWFHRNIEALDQRACWGIDIRTIRGSSATSNHQSGTAMDLNANRHPLGSQPGDNYSSSQIAAIRAKLRTYDGVIRWGGDYSGRKDPMHFEINASTSAVAAVARRIGTGTPAPTTPTAPSTGDDDMPLNETDLAKISKIVHDQVQTILLNTPVIGTKNWTIPVILKALGQKAGVIK